jgi:ATP-dependent DNA helicase RecQ
VHAVTSAAANKWATIETKLVRGEIDILLISPERLANERFRTQVLGSIAAQISLLVIDEAHCISDWGHDFRTHYRMQERIVKTLPPNRRLLAITATANDRVMQDLTAVLGPKLDVSREDLNRASLTLQTLAEQLTTLTVRDAYQV